MVGGWGTIDGETVMFIGQQKVETLKIDNIETLNGKSEGYRNFKLMKMKNSEKL